MKLNILKPAPESRGRRRTRCAGRRLDDRGAKPLHLQDRQRAIGRAVRQQAVGAIDAGETARPGDGGLRVALPLGPSGKHDRHAHRIVGQAGDARRRLPVALGELLREVRPAARIGARIPGPDQPGIAPGVGIVHAARADHFDLLRVDLGLRQQAPQHLQMLLPARNEQGIDGRAFRFRRRDRRADLAQRLQHGIGRAMGIGFERDDRAAVAGDCAGEYRLDELAESILGDEGGIAPLALARSVADDALDLGCGLEAQKIHAVACHLAVVGEGDHRHLGLARHRCHSRHRLRKQRSDDQSGAALERVLGRGPGSFRRALVVLDDELEGIVALEQRKLGSLLQALADHAGLALRRERHQHRHLDQRPVLALVGTERAGLRVRPTRGAGANQHGAEQPNGKAAGSQRSAGTD